LMVTVPFTGAAPAECDPSMYSHSVEPLWGSVPYG
jgi:hypothetical protein